MSEVSTETRTIWDTNSINKGVLADEVCRFTNFQILHHNDVITISYSKYDFTFEIRVSKFICLLNFNS